MFLSQAADHW